jgi:hypothetical protein
VTVVVKAEAGRLATLAWTVATAVAVVLVLGMVPDVVKAPALAMALGPSTAGETEHGERERRRHGQR